MKDVNELNVRRANARAFLSSGVISSVLMYACLLLLAFDLPMFVKVAGIAAAAVISLTYSIVGIRFTRVSEDVIDELNGKLMEEILRYCSEKYKMNDSSDPLKFFFESNEDETSMYLDACLVDKATGKDIEATKVTIMELWRFQKTPEFTQKPREFLEQQLGSLVGTTQSAVDEFFIRFKDYLQKKPE